MRTATCMALRTEGIKLILYGGARKCRDKVSWATGRGRKVDWVYPSDTGNHVVEAGSGVVLTASATLATRGGSSSRSNNSVSHHPLAVYGTRARTRHMAFNPTAASHSAAHLTPTYPTIPLASAVARLHIHGTDEKTGSDGKTGCARHHAGAAIVPWPEIRPAGQRGISARTAR